MSRKLSNILMALAVIGLVCAPLLVDAGGHRGFGGKGMRGPGGFCQGLLGHLGDRLELTDEQRQQIEAIVEQEQPAIEELRQAMSDARSAYHETLEPGQFDEAATRVFAESQAQQHVELFVAVARLKAQVFAVLTPEQQEQLQEIRSSRRDRSPGMGGMFGR